MSFNSHEAGETAFIPSRKRLVVFFADFPPVANAGAQRAYHQILALSRRYHISLYTCSLSKAPPLPDHIQVTQYPMRTPQNGKNLFVRIIRELSFCVFSCLTACRCRCDAGLVSIPPFLLLLPIFVLQLRKKSTFIDMRDLYPEAYFEQGLVNRSGVAGGILRKISKSIFNASSHIFTVSDGMKSHFQTMTSTPITVIRNGFDFSGQNETPQAFFKKEAGWTYVITHGNFGRFQNVPLLNKIIISLRKEAVKFIIAGFGSHYDDVADGPNVIKLGHIAHENIASLLADADIGLSVRKSSTVGATTIPVKLYECIGAGIPCISIPRMADVDFMEHDGSVLQFGDTEWKSAVQFIKRCCADGSLLAELKTDVSQAVHLHRRGFLNEKMAEVVSSVMCKRTTEH